MFRIKGAIQMPENLYEIIKVISEAQKKEPTGYLASFERLIHPVMIATLFGLYKSQELPPINEEEISLEKSYKFNVDISSFAEILNHLLFCLWVQKKGLPGKSSDNVKFREELYNFISKLLDIDYYRSVLIPFYLKKADESENSGTSFLYRLWNSDEVGLKLTLYSPEYLALEFSSAQSEFLNNTIAPLEKKTRSAMARKK